MAFNSKSLAFLLILNLWINCSCVYGLSKHIPLIVTTWDYENATDVAWDAIYNKKGSAIDAIESGCSSCEDTQCKTTVGFGGSPDEDGETTLDAMLMDGVTMDVGAVAGLRYVKNAISVARHVLENTAHSLLVGDLATEFAVEMGFKKESLQTDKSRNMWIKWKANKCQPNFWKNVVPDPSSNCGPYQPKTKSRAFVHNYMNANADNHDTIGMIAIDSKGHVAAGTSTNGAKNKIPGRVGDSPIPGAGSYADQEVGAAAATGDGDVMMRFLPSFLTVELMRQGETPAAAASVAIKRIIKHYPKFSGALIALNKDGQFGAACHGLPNFPYYVANLQLGKPTLHTIPCIG